MGDRRRHALPAAVPSGHAGRRVTAAGESRVAGVPVEALRRVPLFADLSQARAQADRAAVQGAPLRRRRDGVQEGSGGAAFFVIESGEATVTIGGKERATLRPGDYFGEIALIDEGARMATITATTDLVCYGLTYWDFRPLVEANGADRLEAAAVDDEDVPGGAPEVVHTIGLSANDASVDVCRSKTVIPETQYARAEDGTHLAYKVVGDGPVDLVYLQPWFSHIEFIWEEPLYERFLQRIASFSRLIIFDRRGSGMSDPVPVDRPPDLETRMDDARAVMDAVGSKRAVVYAASESGVLGCLFAATHPDRTVALMIIGCYPRSAWAPDYPWGDSREDHEAIVSRIEASWGTDAFVREQWSAGSDDRLVAWLASLSRHSMSPGAAVAYERMIYEDDVRDILPTIHVPTLILHREHDLPEPQSYLAEHIPGAEIDAAIRKRAHSFPG